MKNFLKWAVIIIIAMIVIGNLFNGGAEEAPEEVVEPADYEIVEISEDHWMDSRRYNYRVVIEEEVDREKFESTARTILDEAKEEKDYSGITMWFYTFEELSDGAYTLGRVVHAPEGDWSKAAETTPGDYDQMTYEIDFKEKVWSQRPSQEEVKIYETWDYILYEYYDEHEDQEDVILDMTAEELGISAEEVDEAVSNVSIWIMAGR